MVIAMVAACAVRSFASHRLRNSAQRVREANIASRKTVSLSAARAKRKRTGDMSTGATRDYSQRRAFRRTRLRRNRRTRLVTRDLVRREPALLRTI